ncbi:MAG: peptidoglycan DD-metalloendopeptidase family protein [Gemmatimonadota bacterium]
MSERRWTVVVVPPGSGASKAIEVSQTLLKLATGLAVVFVLTAFLFGYATLSRSISITRNTQLERENALLSEELGRLHGSLGLISDTISRIAERDAKVRLLANLEPNDPGVQKAGIGGPAGSSITSRALANAGVLGRRTEEIRVDMNALIRRANLLASSFKEATDSLHAHSDRLSAMPSLMPTTGWLSSAFASMRMHPILHIERPHEGIDVAAPMGASIEAPAAGTVISVQWETGYGNTLEIDHGFGLVTRYAHTSKILVHVGQRVSRGQQVALVGNTGLATGPHLHYEVHVNGRPVDPLKYVLPDAIVD